MKLKNKLSLRGVPQSGTTKQSRSNGIASSRLAGIAMTLVFLVIFLSFSSCSKKGKDKSTLRVAVPQGPVMLDPRLATDAEGIKVTRLIFDGLFKINENLEVVPKLANNYEKLSDTSYRFYLRDNIKFHNGEPLTAEDVAYTYRSIASGEITSPFKGTYSRIKDIVVESPYVIRIDLTEPYSPILTALIIGIVPKSSEGKASEFAKAPIGTGAYKFAEYVPDVSLKLAANESYFGGAPKIPTLLFDIVKDDNVRILKLIKGDVDLVQNAIPPILLEKVESDKKILVKTDTGLVMTYMGLNLTDPILSNEKVRKALAYAIDRDAVISHRFKGLAVKANSILFPGHWAYDKGLTQYEFDPARAKQLLDEAGFKDPDGDGPMNRFDLVYKTSTVKERVDIAEMIAHQLLQVGIGVKVEPYEWGKLYEDIKKGNFQMYSMSWSLLSEPDMFYDICHSSQFAPNGVNRSKYKNAEVDSLVTEARVTSDVEKRMQLYFKVQQIVLNELPYIPLWYEKNVVAYRDNLKNVTLRPDAAYITFAGVEK